VAARIGSSPVLSVPYRFQGLASLTRNEVLLWNWYCRATPSPAEWRSWIAEILQHLVEKPSGLQLQLVQTHLIDEKFGEKVLNFGSKEEIILGRQAENDVVLPANAISSKHARLFLRDGDLFLEDQGGQLGTYLWDARIPARQAQRVRTGDQFTVFPYRFRVLLEPRWSPGTDVVLGDSRIQVLSRAEYFRKTPLGYSSFIIDASPSGERALVDANPAFLDEVRKGIFGPLKLRTSAPSVPSDQTLLVFVLLAILERLNRKLKFPLRFNFMRGTRNVGPDATRGLSINVSVRVGGLSGDFRIFLPLAFLSKCEPDPSLDASNCPPDLSWSFPVAVGFVDLSPEEIAQIGLGDILVAERGPAILFPTDFCKGWTMTALGSNFDKFNLDKYFDGGSSLPNEAETASSQDRPALGTLPLRLHVVLAEKELTVGEIQAFTPGTIIELNAGKVESVQLMINGKILGEGELVDVEGNLAVKVVRWRNS
jgi:flagellar motor switch/type III secretory pathway protein FliN